MKMVRVYDVALGPYGKFLLSLTIFAVGGFAGGRAMSRDGATLRSGVIGLAALLFGVAAGVVCWNGLEDYVLSRFGDAIYQERKLFPVDVMLIWMLGWAPLLVGLAAGMLVPSHRSGQRSTRP
jgi:hypothetical protein